MSEALIVGIDPGSTSAVAALNLDKELVLLESDKEFPSEDIILKLIQKGHTVLVGCDTESMPSLADDVASSLGARKFSPEEDISKRKKKSLGSEGDNSHEKDAIAAAIHAYNQHQRQIKKINEEAGENKRKRTELAKKRFREGIRTSEI